MNNSGNAITKGKLLQYENPEPLSIQDEFKNRSIANKRQPSVMSVAVEVRNESYERSLQDQEQANGGSNADRSKASSCSSSSRSMNSIRVDQW